MLNKRICLFVYKRLTNQWIVTLYTSDEPNIDICFEYCCCSSNKPVFKTTTNRHKERKVVNRF